MIQTTYYLKFLFFFLLTRRKA